MRLKGPPTAAEYFAANPTKACSRCGVTKPNDFDHFGKRWFGARDEYVTVGVCYDCRTARRREAREARATDFDRGRALEAIAALSLARPAEAPAGGRPTPAKRLALLIMAVAGADGDERLEALRAAVAAAEAVLGEEP